MICLGLGHQFMTDAAMKKTYIDTVQAQYPLISEEGADRKIGEIKGCFPSVYPRLGLVDPDTKEIVCNVRGCDELEQVLDSLLMGTSVTGRTPALTPQIRGHFCGKRMLRICGLPEDAPVGVTVLSIDGRALFCAHTRPGSTVRIVYTPVLARGVYVLSIDQNTGNIAVPLNTMGR